MEQTLVKNYTTHMAKEQIYTLLCIYISIYFLYPRSGPLRNFEQVYLDPPSQFKVRMYKISTHKY